MSCNYAKLGFSCYSSRETLLDNRIFFPTDLQAYKYVYTKSFQYPSCDEPKAENVEEDKEKKDDKPTVSDVVTKQARTLETFCKTCKM